MENTYEEIDLGFSTADAEIESINYYKGQFELKIIDWQERRLKIKFNDVLAYSLQFMSYEIKFDEKTSRYMRYSDYDNDTIYNVKDSKWLAKQIEMCTNPYYSTEKTEHLKHYKLCFNMNDEELDIICSEETIVEEY